MQKRTSSLTFDHFRLKIPDFIDRIFQLSHDLGVGLLLLGARARGGLLRAGGAELERRDAVAQVRARLLLRGPRLAAQRVDLLVERSDAVKSGFE